MKYLERINWFPPNQKVLFIDQQNNRNWVSFKSIRHIAKKEDADIWWCSEGITEFVRLRLPD